MTGLPPERIAELRERARREAGPFLDPRAFRQIQTELPRMPTTWLRALLGRDELSLRWMEPWEITLLLAGYAEDADWIAAERAREQQAARASMEEETARARAAGQARWDAWVGLRDRLPVPVFVGHNWTIGHYERGVTGRDHIVVQADLRVGRLRRAARAALCETPATTRSGTARKPNPLDHLEREPNALTDPKRIPTCRACLRAAERIARDPG